MKVNTKWRKKATRIFQQMYGREVIVDRMYEILCKGRQGMDVFMKELGRMMAETIMYIDRSDFKPFTIFIDTIHRGGEAFMICFKRRCGGGKEGIGILAGGYLRIMFNVEELLADMERRGLRRTKRIIWITGGGKGIIKTLRDRL